MEVRAVEPKDLIGEFVGDGSSFLKIPGNVSIRHRKGRDEFRDTQMSIALVNPDTTKRNRFRDGGRMLYA